MAKQTERIAYGRPDYGGIVIGGENQGVYSLGDDWADDWNGERLLVTTTMWVHGDTAAQVEERIAALEALGQDLGNLGITGADKISATVALTISGRKVVLTASSGFWSSAHVGLPVDVDGVGAFQITEFISSTVVNCLIPEPLTLPTPAAGLTATLGTVFRRVEESAKAGGFNGRGRFVHLADSENEPRRRKFRLELSFALPASDFRGDDNDRQSARIVFSDPVGEPRTLSITGTFTAADAETAFTRYLAQIPATITALATTYFGSGVSFQKVGADQVAFDDNENLLSFSLTRKEITVDESLAATDHPAISDANIEINPVQDYTHGITGQTPPAAFNLTYNCPLVRGAVADADVPELWFGIIVPRLLAILRTTQNSAVIIDRISLPQFNPVTRRLSGSIAGVLPDTGSEILQYARRTSYRLNRRRSFNDFWDGPDYASILSSPGPLLQAVVNASWTQLYSSGQGGGGAGSSLGIFDLNDGAFGFDFGGGDQLGIFDLNDGAFGFDFGDGAGGLSGDGVDGGKIEFRPLNPPSDPVAYFARLGIAIGPGKWVEEATVIDDGPAVSRGNDPRGLSDEATQTTTTATRIWRWWNGGGVDPKSGAQEPSGPSVIGGTTTVER